MPTSEQRSDGGWYPACPLPFYVGWRLRKCRCECGDVFKSEAKYQEHWYATHDPSRPADQEDTDE